MKITKDTLKEMIAEEMESMQEQMVDPLGAIGNTIGKGAQSAIRLANRAARGDLTDEEDDFQRARELERATDAGKAITRKQKAAATAARDLPRRSMAQKSQDPALKARGRAGDAKARREQAIEGRRDALAGREPRELVSADLASVAAHEAYMSGYNKAKKADTGSALGRQASGPSPDEDPAYLAAMRRGRGIGDDQSIPLPQQSNVRESFNQKGKTKMKLTKNSLKKLIKEELGALSEGAGGGYVIPKQEMEGRLIPLLQEAIELVDQYVQDVDQQKTASAVSPVLRLLEHLKAAQRLADRGMTRSAQGPSRGAVEPVARPGAYNQSLPDSRSRD